MSWENKVEISGVPILIQCGSALYDDEGGKPGFSVSLMSDCDKTNAMILTEDPRLFAVIKEAQIIGQKLSEAFDAKFFLSSWIGMRGPLLPRYLKKNCMQEVRSFAENEYLSASEVGRIKKAVGEIESYIVKKTCMKKRRSEFQGRQAQLMLALIERDGYVCQITGATESLTIDHIIPLSKGGSDDLSNLRLISHSENSKKSDRLVSEVHPHG